MPGETALKCGYSFEVIAVNGIEGVMFARGAGWGNGSTLTDLTRKGRKVISGVRRKKQTKEEEEKGYHK